MSARSEEDDGEERAGKLILTSVASSDAENEENDPSLKALSFLYGAYEPKRWWIEVFETLRKLALTGFLVFLAPGTAAQIVMSMLMCLATTRVYSGTKPFIDPFNDKFAEVALWQLFMTMLGALCIKVNLDDESLQDRGYFDMALTATQFLPLLLVAAGDAMVVSAKASSAIGGKKSLVHNEFEKERKKELELMPVSPSHGVLLGGGGEDLEGGELEGEGSPLHSKNANKTFFEEEEPTAPPTTGGLLDFSKFSKKK